MRELSFRRRTCKPPVGRLLHLRASLSMDSGLPLAVKEAMPTPWPPSQFVLFVTVVTDLSTD